MTFNNQKKFSSYRRLLLVALIIVAVDFVLAGIPGTISRTFETHWLALLGCGIIITLALLKVNYFSYEDEYEIIHIVSKPLLFGLFKSKSDINFEFPKRTVVKVSMSESSLKRTLSINLETQHGSKRTRNFSLSFISKDDAQSIFNHLKSISEKNVSELSA